MSWRSASALAARLTVTLSMRVAATNSRCVFGCPSPSTAISRHSGIRSEEHTSELQSLMRISYAVFCLKKNKNHLSITPRQTTPHLHTTYHDIRATQTQKQY